MCQPGKPRPQGLSHSICRCSSPLNFHSAKSVGERLSPSSTRWPARRPGDVEPRQVAVAFQARGVEVDAVGGAVGEALALDVGDEGDLLGDVVGGARPDGGRQDAQALQVALEGVGVEGGDVPGAAAGAPAALFHLVLAGVGVRGQVADVGDVDDVLAPRSRSAAARGAAGRRTGRCAGCRCARSRRPSGRRRTGRRGRDARESKGRRRRSQVSYRISVIGAPEMKKATGDGFSLWPWKLWM